MLCFGIIWSTGLIPASNPQSMEARNCDAKGRAAPPSSTFMGEQGCLSALLGPSRGGTRSSSLPQALVNARPRPHCACQTHLPLFQPTASSEEGKFAASFLHVTWKMESSAGVLLPSLHLGSSRKYLYDCCPKPPRKSFYTRWTTLTQISKNYSLFNLGYGRSSVNTSVGSGLISIIEQKPSSSMRLLGTL